MPEGPAAAPRLDDRKLWTNRPSSNEKTSGWASKIDCDNGALDAASLLLWSVRALRVALSPPTTWAPSNTNLPADNSPICTNCNALSALYLIKFSRVGFRLLSYLPF